MFDDFIVEIKEFNPMNIYFLCSGGYDSTYMLLQLYDKFPKISKFILYNNTLLELKECKDLVYLLSLITGLKLIETKPNVKISDIMKESFLAIDKAIELVKNKRYYKQVFPCCYYLKEKPSKEFYKKTCKSIFFLGIKKSDSNRRRLFLESLENTYINFKKRFGVFYAYPLRDIGNSEVETFIKKFPFPVRHSGCKICPIILLFNMVKVKDIYSNSRQYYFSVTGHKWQNQCLLTDYPCFWDNVNVMR